MADALNISGILRMLEVVLQLFSFFPEQAQVTDNARYDFVIVGAGSAGCVLAARLSENPNVSVLLIEAGDNPTLEVMLPGLASRTEFSTFDWNYTTVNDGKAYQCFNGDVNQAARGHGLGGSSSINYMIYSRGDPYDYNQWAKIVNCSDWDYNHVLPYFKKSERMEDPAILKSPYKHFHGTEGPMGINVYPDSDQRKYLNALKEIGYKIMDDTNGNDTLGFNFPMFTVSEGLRQSTCFCFVSPVKDRKNLHVMRNTKATKVIFNNNVAVGVEIITMSNEKMTIIANLEVILSAGAVNTPQLLMLSGIGPQDHLQSLNITTIKNLPVGYNLQDHISALMLHQTEPLNSSLTLDPRKPEELYVNGFVALNKSQKHPDTQFLMLSTRNTPGIMNLFLGFDNDIYTKAMSAKGREILLSFVVNLHPVSRGRIMLNSADPNDKPKIYSGSLSNQIDVDNTIRYIKEYLRLENSTYFKSVNAQRLDFTGDRCKGFTVGSKEYWECYTRCFMVSVFHISCTCPMGSVVDARLRVLGIKKLRVVDASVFPTIPSGNTNAPTIMVAEKAADMIKADNHI